jgi:hypothetical protein
VLCSGLMGTPMGDKMWTSNIKAIVQATLRTINLAIMQLAVHQEPYINALCDTRLRIYPTAVRARHALSREAIMFGAVQKKYGFEQLIGSMQQIFLDRGVDANMVIVPGDTAALLRCRQETRDFALNGALAQMYQLDPMRTIPSYVYNERYTLFEHRGMFVNSDGQRDSPMVRERSIGQFFVIEYGQDIKIIDHDNQRWHKITWDDAWRATGGKKGTPDAYESGKGYIFGGDDGEAIFDKGYTTKPHQPAFAARAGSAPVRINMAAVAEPANWGKKGAWVASRAEHAQAHFGGVTQENFGTSEIQAGFAALAKDLKQGKFGAQPGMMDAADVAAQASAGAQVLFGATALPSGDSSQAGAQTGLPTDRSFNFKILIFRPNVTFRMGAVVAGRGGEETGFTAFGNANFELSDEATTKTALGHYTCYFKPIVHTPKNLMVSPDAVFQGYIGGGGVKFYGSDSSPKMDSFEAYARNPFASRGSSGSNGDLVAIRVPKDWTCDGVMSSMGYGNVEFEGLMDTCTSWGKNEGARDKAFKTMKNMARAFASLNANQPDAATENVEVPFAERRYGLNHLCYQGTQVTMKADEKDITTPARGHLADCEYVDSSVREWSGHIAFRDVEIKVDTNSRKRMSE